MLVPTQLGLIGVDAARQEIYFLYSWSCVINLGLLLLLEQGQHFDRLAQPFYTESLAWLKNIKGC